MAREVGAKKYSSTSQSIQEEREQSSDRVEDFVQSFDMSLTKILIQQQNQKILPGSDRQRAEQHIKSNWQTIFEQVNVGIAFIATSGKFLRVNHYLCSLLKYSESAICSLNFQDITHTEDLKVARQYFDGILSGHQTNQALEQRYLRQDGQWQWVNITLSLAYDACHVPLYLVATIQDIDSRQQTQAKLQAVETLLANLFQNSIDGIFLLNILPDGQLVYEAANPAYTRLICNSNQQIIGKTTAEILPVKIAEVIESKYHYCLATKKPLEFVIELQEANRNWRVYLVPIENQKGQIIKLQGTVKDTIEGQTALEKQARYRNLLKSITFQICQSVDIKEILQTTVSDLRETFNTDRVMLWKFLPDGTGKVLNESVKTGFPAILQKAAVSDCDRDMFPDEYLEGYAYTCKNSDSGEISAGHRAFLQRYQIKSNLVLPISRYLPSQNPSASPSKQEKSAQASKSLWGLLCVHQCCCYRQWTQDEIELLQHLVGQLTIALSQAELLKSEIKQRNELARSNNELEQFAYIASHDLQAPLQTVSNYVQLIQRRYQGKLDAKGEKFINYILDGVCRMRTQINDLLEYSRVGRQRGTFHTTDCNLVIEQVLSNLRSEIEKQQAIVTYSRNLPTVIADYSQLVVLFQNLISNAIKYRTSAKPIIKIAACNKGDNWQFFVSDNGIGIEPKYQQRIFQLFQRLHTQDEYPGTGIGLAICQKIVERHGGQIRVDSQLNSGSTFNFTIPA